MPVNIIFLIDSTRCINQPGGTLAKPQYYPGAGGDGGHPPLIWGTGGDPSQYKRETGDFKVPVTAGDEVYISLQELNAAPNVTLAPVGFIAMTWNGKNFAKGVLGSADQPFGDISFLDTRNDLYDYEYVSGQNSNWGPDSKNPQYWATTHDARLGSVVKRGPYILLPTLSPPGQKPPSIDFAYGVEFYCTINGELVGTYEFDPIITINPS